MKKDRTLISKRRIAENLISGIFSASFVVLMATLVLLVERVKIKDFTKDTYMDNQRSYKSSKDTLPPNDNL